MTGNPRTEPFIRHHRRYDDWFERHGPAYVSELLAVRALLPWEGRGLEIGVGTGRFAGPLGVKFGIDPAGEILSYARAGGVSVARAVAEALPFGEAVFDYALVVTTICFVDDARAMLHEIARVLRPGGKVIIGLIDRESPLGQDYVTHQAENVFYREATFYSAAEVEALLKETGFAISSGYRLCPHRFPRPTRSSQSAQTLAAAPFWWCARKLQEKEARDEVHESDLYSCHRAFPAFIGHDLPACWAGEIVA